MSTQILTSSPLAQKIWRATLIHQAEVNSLAMAFVGEAEDDAIVSVDDFARKKGDLIQHTFSPTRDFRFFLEGEQKEGQENSVDFQTLTWKIGYGAFTGGLENIMSQQRTFINVKKATHQKMAINWERRWNKVIFNQLAGYTPATGNATTNALSGFNTITTVDETHIYRPNGRTTDQSITSADPCTLDVLEGAMAKLKSTSGMDYPIATTSSDYYYWIVSTDQARQLRQNTSDTGWRDLERAKIEGGSDFEGSALAKGYLGGPYHNVILVECDYIPLGVNSSSSTTSVANVRRSILIGAQGAYIGWGQDFTDGDHIDWREQIRDYDRWGAAAMSVFGVKRTEWPNLSGTTQTYGLMVIPTYAAF